MKPSKEAIEAARDEIYLETFEIENVAADKMECALISAYKIDGTFNDGVNACQAYLRSVHHSSTAEMLEKLKKD